MTHQRTAVAAFITVFTLGCTESPPTGPDLAPAQVVVPSPRVYVLNAQLRGIIDPDIEPSAARGHVLLKLTENDDGTFAAEWRGRIFNPANESFVRGTAGIINREIDPVLTFFRLGGAGIGCDVIDFDSDGLAEETTLTAEFALAMIINPDIHEARFESLDRTDGAIVGSFGIIDPEILVGFNPQPDPPKGQVVRCAV